MDFIFKHFWLLLIVATFINSFIIKFNSKKYILKNSDLEEGYSKLFKGMLFYLNIPWLIMGIGMLFGMTKNSFDFFNPKAMNPIVLTFHGSIIVLWVLSIWWIYFNKGAEFLANHPGAIQIQGPGIKKNLTAKQIKMFWPIFILGGVFGMYLMWTYSFEILQP